jgi:hypothetical protein
MSAAADGGNNSSLRSGSDCVLHIAYICATRDKARGTRYHGIPNVTRVLVAAFAGAQQITFESLVERRVNLFTGFDHLVMPPRKFFPADNDSLC